MSLFVATPKLASGCSALKFFEANLQTMCSVKIIPVESVAFRRHLLSIPEWSSEFQLNDQSGLFYLKWSEVQLTGVIFGDRFTKILTIN
jgi:hypothetical protein